MMSRLQRNRNRNRVNGLGIVAGVGIAFASACASPPPRTEIRSGEEIVVPGETREGVSTPDNLAGGTSMAPVLRPLPDPTTSYEPQGREMLLSPTPPDFVTDLYLAPDSVEGLYVPTLNYIDHHPYGLLLFYQRDTVTGRDVLHWWLVRDPLQRRPKTLGMGTWVERDGGIEVTQFQAQSNGDPIPVAVEQFAATKTRNRWTVGQVVLSQGGTTAMGQLAHELGPDIHWLRISMVDEKGQSMVSSRLCGIFNPISNFSEIDRVKRADTSRRLILWPDGTWRLVVPASAAASSEKTTIYGGTWHFPAANSNRVIFTQTIPPEPHRVNQPLQEEYTVVFSPDDQAMWMMKVTPDPRGSTKIIAGHIGDDEWAVFQWAVASN